MRIRAMTVVAGLAAAGIGSAALGQTPLPLTNGNFENRSLFNSVEPEGWHNLSGPNFALHRALGDGRGFMPAPRSGTRCIEIRTPGFSEFRGFTTDTLNFFLPNFPFYDPLWQWEGPDAGDLVLTGWYYIPTDNPITGDLCGIKLNVKRANQDYATLDPWGGETATIQGDTGNQWVAFEVRWSLADIQQEVLFLDSFGCGGSGQPCGGCFDPCVGPGGYPDHMKITIGRFGFGGTPSSGSIFWDDITYTIVPPTPSCPADFNGDGFLDFFDYDDYVNCFETGSCPPGKDADFNGDGFVDFFDYDDYVGAFEQGC
jgi:hypothetical protein